MRSLTLRPSRISTYIYTGALISISRSRDRVLARVCTLEWKAEVHGACMRLFLHSCLFLLLFAL